MSAADPFGIDDEVISQEYKPKLNFITFWLMLLGQPRKFFTEHFDNERSPYLWLVLGVVGVSRAAERLNMQLLTQFNRKRGPFNLVENIPDWTSYWGFAICYGLFGGLIYYFLGGWWYNVRIGWAGGEKDSKTARFLFLYSEFIPLVFSLYHSVHESFQHDTPLDAVLERDHSKPLLLAIALASLVSVFVSWRGVVTVTRASTFGALTWFFILPMMIYMAAFMTLLAR